MSEPASLPQSAERPALQFRLAVEGVVDSVRDAGEYFETRLIIPAPDRYSAPGAFLIRSKKRLGAEGTEVRGIFQLFGRGRYWDRNKGTRNEERVQTADMWLAPVNE